MKYLIYFLFVLLVSSCKSEIDHLENSDAINKKPNIILILTDDQGYGDLACHGNPLIKTPSLDKLHDQSVRFTNFHVGTTCAPSRAGIMSGVHCNRAGAWHTVVARSFLSTRYKTMADYLKEDGYSTGIFGKWHLGDNYPFRPQDRGFDEVVIHGGGGVGQTPDYWNNDYFDDTYFHNGQPEKYPGYCTDVWFQEAGDFMVAKAQSKDPFFCFISTNAPHGPHHVPQKYIDMYARDPKVPKPNFYGQITNIDDNIGRLENLLEENGLSENTIIIFLTDNGTAAGASFDNAQMVTKGFNAQMRGRKGSEYEGGHRVPLFIRFPEGMKITKRAFNELASYNDLLPTLLDGLNIPISNETKIDGTSLWSLIKTGKQSNLKDRILISDTQRNLFPVKWKNASVMQNSWRLVNNQELYNLAKDPSQQTNIISVHPEVAKTLSAGYESWWTDLQDDLKHENRIVVGSKIENPSVLTSHDWRTPKDPPWHQSHIRSGKISNGPWQIEIARSGQYNIRLHRYPPYLNLDLNSEMEIGDEVSGGVPFATGTALEITEAKLRIQGQELKSGQSANGKYFEFTTPLKEGSCDMQSWFIDQEKIERGVYFVEIEFTTD